MTWEGKYYVSSYTTDILEGTVLLLQNIPYEAMIPDNFKPGRKLKVSAEWLQPSDKKKQPEKMEINLFAGNDVAFQLSPRLNQKVALVEDMQ